MSDTKKHAMMFHGQRLDGTEFERFADDYGNVRPTYPAEAMEDIIRECGLSKTSHVLEIGMGTGIATAALLKSGASFVGIEPGENLLRIAKDRLGEGARIEFVGQTFEAFQTDQTFDTVLSATAFHWLKEPDKYQRVARMLKPLGKLVVMWNSFCRNNDPVHAEIEDAYQKLLPDVYPPEPDVNAKVLRKANGKVREILESQTFFIAFLREYVLHHVYDPDRYVALLRTYPKIIQAADDVRETFLQEIRNIVQRHGRVIVPVLTTVCVCRRSEDFTLLVHADVDQS
jgi:ubiquinone/menaquinone biosynthesis C-methylase UbiE